MYVCTLRILVGCEAGKSGVRSCGPVDLAATRIAKYTSRNQTSACMAAGGLWGLCTKLLPAKRRAGKPPQIIPISPSQACQDYLVDIRDGWL
jgi:hypothetical protein